jgi:hypothetical protein
LRIIFFAKEELTELNGNELIFGGERAKRAKFQEPKF